MSKCKLCGSPLDVLFYTADCLVCDGKTLKPDQALEALVRWGSVIEGSSNTGMVYKFAYRYGLYYMQSAWSRSWGQVSSGYCRQLLRGCDTLRADNRESKNLFLEGASWRPEPASP